MGTPAPGLRREEPERPIIRTVPCRAMRKDDVPGRPNGRGRVVAGNVERCAKAGGVVGTARLNDMHPSLAGGPTGCSWSVPNPGRA